MHEARQEFLAKGYQKASLRQIAAGAGITHTNIYHYFKSKDALYGAIMAPIITTIKSGIRMILEQESSDQHNDLEDHLFLLDKPVEFVHENRDILNLLIFHSSGSSLANFRDDLVDELTKGYYLIVEGMNRRHGKPQTQFSDFFLHNIASLWINFTTECLMHEISKEEMNETARHLMTFIYLGWCGLYGLGCEHH